MADYIDPGDAFSTALQSTMLQQANQRRQAILDAITQQRETRLGQNQDLELQMRQQDLADRIQERRIKEHQQKLSQLNPGDIPDASLIKEGKDLGMPLRLAPPPTATIPAGQQTVGMPNAGGQPSDVTMPGAVSQPETLQTGPAPYRGTPQQEMRIKLADSVQSGAEPTKILSDYIRMGGDPREAEGIVTSIRGPKLQPEPTLIAKDASGALVPGVVTVTAQGVPMLDGKPLPPGVAVHRMDPNAQGPVHDTPTGLVRIQPDGTVKPVLDANGKQVQSYHPPPASFVLQTNEGPMLGNKGSATAKPILGPDGKPIDRLDSAQTRAMAEGARMIQPHIAELDSMAQDLDKRGLFGPVMSRVRQAMASAGTTLNSEDPAVVQQALEGVSRALLTDPQLSGDRKVGQFATALGLMASGAGRVHGGARSGGSIQMIQYMKSLLSDSSTLPMFQGRLDALGLFMGGYARGSHATEETPPPAVPATPATTRYKATVTKGGDNE